jgi:hypothetical protein
MGRAYVDSQPLLSAFPRGDVRIRKAIINVYDEVCSARTFCCG